MNRLEIPLCEWCGQEIRRTGSRGPAPRYCSHNKGACRVAAHRARRATAAMHAELEAEGVALDPITHAQPVPKAAVDEQVARAFLEAKTLAGTFARLGADARPALAWRCSHVAQALATAIKETLGET